MSSLKRVNDWHSLCKCIVMSAEMEPQMMITAFACWNKRVAPVFDTAQQVHVIEVTSGRIVRATREPLASDLPVHKAFHLSELGVSTLVCGAISKSLHEIVTAYSIRVIPFVAGDLREVIQAWLKGSLNHKTLAMPGCRGSRYISGLGQGSVHGHRRAGQCRGRMKGSDKSIVRDEQEQCLESCTESRRKQQKTKGGIT